MNLWYVSGIYLMVITMLFIEIIVSFTMFGVFRKRNKKAKKSLTCGLLGVGVLVCVFIFISSHSTYYKYNDWWIMGNNILKVQERYGKFDLGTYKEGKSGKVGYYIYTDNGPIMPDHAKHYYHIQYDDQGVVIDVFEGIPIGG